MRELFRALLGLVAMVAAVACSRQASPIAAFPPVAALGQPSLPSWIASVSPLSHAQSLAQIRIIFARPVTKVEALEGDGPRGVLAHVHIYPELPGRFVVLTPKMIGFVAERALPVGARVRVTLSAGLRDMDGDTLGNDVAWTFETDPLAFSGLPRLLAADASESPPAPLDLRPILKVTANAEVDAASLGARATLAGAGDVIPLSAKLEPMPSPLPGSDAAERFDASRRTYVYDVTPVRDLRKATRYAMRIAPGVLPALGNVATAVAATGDFRTYGALAVVPTPEPPAIGRFADGDPAIGFTNPINAASVAANVTIAPQPASVQSLLTVPDGGSEIDIDPYALAPDSKYVVTIAAGLKDIFGQSLGASRTIDVATSDFTPGAWAPSGWSTIPAGSGVDLNFYATNLPGARYRAAFARVDAARTLGGEPDPLAFLPSPGTWKSEPIAGAKPNAQSVGRVSLQQELGGPYGTLAYGFATALDADPQVPGTTGIVQLTNLGIFAQWFPGRGLVLVQHLSDGSPAGNARVSLYRVSSSASTVAPDECAQGVTSSAGEFDLSGIDLQRCYASSGNEPPSIGVVVNQGSDVATLTTYSWSGAYAYDVFAGWDSGAPLSRGTIASDRQMYQPGESVELTGFAYSVRNDTLAAEKHATYKLQLQYPSGASKTIGAVQTDAYGIFSYRYRFAAQQPLGYYSLLATGDSGNVITGSLRVAEFKPPNFKMAVSLDRTWAVAGSAVAASANAAYLFGAPLDGGKAHVDITRDVAQLAPKGWDDFSFGPQWFWPERPPSFDTDVLQEDLSFDHSGNVALQIPVPHDLPFPMTYGVDIDATDVSNLSVSDSRTFTALPTDAIIGLSSDIVGAAGTAMPVRVIVTDAAGRAVAGRGVHLDLQKMTYVAATKDEEGGEAAQDSVRYDTVASDDVTSSTSPVVASLKLLGAASFRIRATFNGAKNAAGATDVQVFSFGPNADYGDQDTSTVKITLDKKTYKIGDTATALVASPFDAADIYLAVVRDDVISRALLRGAAGSSKFTFKVTPQMLPNAALEAVVVRRGPPIAGVKIGSLNSLARVGMTGFDVDVSDRYLKLGIVPRRAAVAPSEGQQVDFALTDARGTPVRGKIVAMVVNDAILQLSGYRLPDLVATVFADQPISTRFADSRASVVLQTQTPPLEKGFGYGGGFLGGAAGTRVRSKFMPLAYYGTAIAGASGHATLSFTLPDDLTTWRVLAVAIADDDAHFGTADATFISQLPLMIDPLLPQFARPGDRFDLGVSVTNLTGASGALALESSLTGALAFAGGDPRRQSSNATMTTGTSAYRFPVVVGTPAPSTVSFKASASSAGDAFTVPLEIRDRSITESAVDAGVGTNVNIPIALDRGGELRLVLANSAIPQFAVPAGQLMLDDPLPLADSYASRAVIAAGLGALARPYRLNVAFDPSAVATSSVRDLLGMQRGDGGFKAGAGESESDPFESAYALEALAFVRARGYAVDGDALARARRFASESLANPERFTWCADDACRVRLRFAMLWSLAASGDRRTDFLATIVANSDDLDSATQIRLARYLLATPGWQAQGAAMAAHLLQSTYVTGRYSVANVATRWGWLGSLVDAQSEMLQLMIAERAPSDQIDGAVRALAAQRCRCGWPTLDDAAAAVKAIGGYAATEHLRPTTVTATAGSATVASATFGSNAASQQFTFEASRLRGSTLTIRAGAPVHYVVVYTYPIASDAPGSLSAFRVTREVREPGAPATIATMDLDALKSPVELETGHIYDIGVRVIADHPVDRLVVDDPLPAGLEAIDTSLQTSVRSVVAQSDSWEIDAQQIYKDHVTAFASHLGPGIYEVHYLVRSVTPGRFRWPGARAYQLDAPEEFGRSAAAVLELK